MNKQFYLEQWLTLKEGSGIKSARSKTMKLQFIGISLTVAVSLLIYFQVHSAFIAIVSVAIGWVIAERNALRSRIKLWPKLEKYLNWELINEHISK